jgi:PST family polysaccharide transporter
VNEQSEAALLMAVPGILGTLTFAPWVIHLLYSAHFAPAVEILRWQLLGILGRIITWPIGFVLLARGSARIFFCTELASNLVHLSLLWCGMKLFGLSGLGMAFFGLYVFAAPMTLFVVHRLSGFRWNKSNLRLGGGAMLATAVVFLATTPNMPAVWGMVIGGLITTGLGLYGVRKMAQRSGYSGLGDVLSRLRTRFGRKKLKS